MHCSRGPIADWLTTIDGSELAKHCELVTRLKAEHGLGHGHANALVAHYRKHGTVVEPS